MSEFTFADETLMPGGRGFHFATPPPVDVAHSKQFQHPKPEPTIYAVLARAQHGDFGAFAELLRVMYEHDDAWVLGVCSYLLAHAAPASLLRQLPELLRTPRDAVDPEDVDRDANAQWCIEILSLSNYAWTIPKILDLYRGIGDKQRFGSGCFMLSRLLEPEFGPIFEGPKRVPRDPDDPDWYDPPPRWFDDDYYAMVENAYADLTRTISPDTCVWGGKVLSLPEVAKQALVHVRERRWLDTAYINRMVLEGYTGRDLTGFYDLETCLLQPLAAAAMLEDLLESGELERYEPGVRYFFGHRVPD